MTDKIRIGMNKLSIIILAFLFGVLVTAAAYAMGGPAVEAPATAEVQQAATGEAAAGDMEKARIELTSLEAEREKTENYLDVLNKKIIKAKMMGDSKKVLELQGEESITAARNNKILKKISAIRQKYPDLQPGGKTTVELSAEAPAREEKAEGGAPNIVYHDVEMGDTLVSVSRKYFGTPVYYKEIAKMNNISDVGHVPQGVRLAIDLNMAKSKPVAATPATEVIYHVVMPGETLMGISRKYFNGSASYYREIAEMNGLTGTDINVGMRLKIDKALIKAKKPAL